MKDWLDEHRWSLSKAIKWAAIEIVVVAVGVLVIAIIVS
jgi:hypothetical protein